MIQQRKLWLIESFIWDCAFLMRGILHHISGHFLVSRTLRITTLPRTLLRNLKYETYKLTMYKDTDGALVATINHLHELMGICPFSAQDLVLINFFDQRPDTAKRIFSLRVAEMLESHVKGSAAICLYITAVYHLTEPFFKADFGTP